MTAVGSSPGRQHTARYSVPGRGGAACPSFVAGLLAEPGHQSIAQTGPPTWKTSSRTLPAVRTVLRLAPLSLLTFCRFVAGACCACSAAALAMLPKRGSGCASAPLFKLTGTEQAAYGKYVA